MNYLSHLFNSKKDTPYYRLGVILPDIYPNFSYIHNKYFHSFTEKNSLDSNENELWNGIEQHYLDDSIFHNLPEFDTFVHNTMVDFENNPILKHLERKNFIGHIFFEIILDYLVLKDNDFLVDNLYGDIDSIDEICLMNFLNKIILDKNKNELFLRNFKNFKSKRFLEYYRIKRNLVIALFKVTGKIANWELTDEIEKELLEYIDLYIKKHNYKEVFKNIEKSKLEHT